MKRLFTILLLLISFNLFGQVPNFSKYCYIKSVTNNKTLEVTYAQYDHLMPIVSSSRNKEISFQMGTEGFIYTYYYKTTKPRYNVTEGLQPYHYYLLEDNNGEIVIFQIFLKKNIYRFITKKEMLTLEYD